VNIQSHVGSGEMECDVILLSVHSNSCCGWRNGMWSCLMLQVDMILDYCTRNSIFDTKRDWETNFVW